MMISIGFSFNSGRREPTPAEPASAADLLLQEEVNTVRRVVVIH
jgi:hypothetical protein